MPEDVRQRLNYDAIAHLYDEPGRDHAADLNLAQYLSEHAELSPETMRVLDMGCGTGKQLTANRKIYPDARLVGLDLFVGMLRQAQKRDGSICWTQGNSARTPFKSASFDYITNQFSYPHVLDKPGMMSETYRILKPGGRFVMTNIDPWAMPDWSLYHYFPAARDRDYVDFLPADKFADGLAHAGFVNVQIRHRAYHTTGTLRQFFEYVSDRHRNSQLMIIPDDAYLSGLAQLQAEMDEFGEDHHFESSTSLITISGDKS